MKITPHSNNPGDANPSGDVLRFERRHAARRPISGTATAITAPAGLAIGNRINTLRLVDMSVTGIGATSSKPIALGSVVEVVMPSHGPEHGVDILGEIVRCEPIGKNAGEETYSVGIALRRMAAA